VSPPFHRKFRPLISGDDDFTFVSEFDGFTKLADGLFAYVSHSSDLDNWSGSWGQHSFWKA